MSHRSLTTRSENRYIDTLIHACTHTHTHANIYMCFLTTDPRAQLYLCQYTNLCGVQLTFYHDVEQENYFTGN